MRFAGLGLLAVVALAALTRSGTGFMLFNGIFAAFIVVDLILTKQRLSFKVIRETDGVWQQHQPQRMLFTIANTGGYRLCFTAVEAMVEGKLEADFSDFSGSLQPGEQGGFGYHLTPLRRGDYSLEKLLFKCRSTFGLWYFIEPVSLPAQLCVYPNMRAVGQFSWHRLENRRQLESLKVLKVRHAGKDFDRLKDYTPGDDYRRMNWMATARQGYPVVNTYQLENNQKIYMMVDCGRSLRYRIDGLRQMDAVIETAVLLAHRVDESRDQFAVTAFDSQVRAKLPCGRGTGWCQRVVQTLYPLEASLQQAHYGEAYLQTFRSEHHRSIVMWFTDFDQPRDAQRFMSQLSKGLRRHVHVVLMMERSDYTALAEGDYGEDVAFDKAVALYLQEQREKAVNYLRAHGIFVAMCRPSELPIAALQQYLLSKARLQGE